MQLGAINQKLKNFQYHLNCRHIHDNAGSIELGLKVTVNVCDTKFGFRSLKAELLTESR